MTIVVVGAVALGALGFAGAAIAFAIRNGALAGDNMILMDDVKNLRQELGKLSVELGSANRRAERLDLNFNRERERIYAQVRATYGPAAVGDLAVSELERLLSPPEGGPDGGSHG